MQEKEPLWTIPNILSMYRLAMFPVILVVLWLGHRQLFTWLLAINLLTDILDGYIARNFNQQTKFGARLDSWADVGSYILAYLGIVNFEWDYVVEHKVGLLLFLGLYLSCIAFAFLKFGGVVGLHLYTSKITGYLQGAFILILLWFGTAEWYYYVMIIFGCLAEVEQLAVLYIMKKRRTDVKGLYWVLQYERSGES